MDIDEERLRLITTFAKRYAEELGVPVEVHATMDRREAIRDADFVISSVLAKGYTYYETMRDVSERYGYYRGINSVEWNMVADYHTIWGYYQFKVHMGIARDIEELAPDAWLLIVANPVLELTTMIGRETKVKVVGICHGFLGFRAALEVLAMRLAKERLGRDITQLCAAHDPECYRYLFNLVDLGDVEFEMAGLNHDIWLTRFRYAGEDAYRYIDEWVEEDAERYWGVWREYTTSPWDLDLCPAAVDMYRTYGLLPIGDTVRGGTWKYHWDLKTKQRWYGPYGGPDSEIGCAIRILIVRRSIEELKRAVYDTSTPLTHRYPPRLSGEVLAPIMDSIYNDIPRDSYELPTPLGTAIKAPIYANIMSRGTLPRLPSDVAVEIPVRVDGKGIHPKPVTPPTTKVFNHAILPRYVRMEWALEAFLEGGRDHLVNWLLYDVRTRSMRQVEEVIEAILKLPGNEEMAKHYS